MGRQMVTPETKKCPMCAETIDAQALVCKNCGFDYRTGTRPGTTAQSSGLAVASMVLGILWICWIGSILALIFGYIAKRQIDASGGKIGGRGMAIAGIVLGWIGVGVLLLNLFLGFVPFLALDLADRNVSRAFDSIADSLSGSN